MVCKQRSAKDLSLEIKVMKLSSLTMNVFEYSLFLSCLVRLQYHNVWHTVYLQQQRRMVKLML